MKLINCNVEVDSHYEKVMNLLKSENPDTITLQEATQEYQQLFKDAGYYTSYVPRLKKMSGGAEVTDGELIATRVPHTITDHLYYDHGKELQFEDIENRRETNNEGLLVAEFNFDGQDFLVATTHFTWTPKGEEACENQIADMKALLDFTTKLPPHVLTGDFNIPRQHNHLYEELTKHYTDRVPKYYKSSLDKDFHRTSNNPAKAHLFSDFMVDYIFTQAPYTATNVRLQFGVSDHAAVIADITQE